MVRVSRFSLLLAVFSFLTAFTALYAQGGADDVKHKFAPINTAIPSLSIAPDARGGAMGDNGVATGTRLSMLLAIVRPESLYPIRLGYVNW